MLVESSSYHIIPKMIETDLLILSIAILCVIIFLPHFEEKKKILTAIRVMTDLTLNIIYTFKRSCAFFSFLMGLLFL